MTKIVSLVALAGVIVPSVFAFIGVMSLDAVKLVALIATVLWFVATPLWMGRELTPADREVEI